MENGDDNDEFDTSWIDNDNSREPLDEIELFFIYMDSENAIEKIDYEMEAIPSSGVVTKERLLQIVQMKRHMANKKYRLVDMVTFQLPLESVNLKEFIDSDNVSNFLKPHAIFNEFVVQPALFIFHDYTSMYFFFSEAIKPLKSVLRNPDENKITKKVRIADDSYLDNKRKSMKRFFKKKMLLANKRI